MRHSSALRLILALALITTFFVGCSRDPNVRKQKYFESGQRYFDKGQYREAAIQYKNAIQIDSTYGNAHYGLAQALLKLQQWNPAYQELARTLELQPDNYPARLDLANLLIAGRDFKQAQEQTDQLLQKQPNNQQVHMAAANLLIGQGNYPAAIAEMQKAIALGPGNWEPYLDLALLQIRTNQPDAAEVNFKKAVEVNPQAAQAQLALGGYYQSRSRFSEAEQQFRHAMDLDPKDPDPPAALARLYIAQGKKAEAEAFLKQVKARFPDNSTGYRMLGDFYFATGDLDKATAEYGIVYHDHPKDLQVEKNYVQLLILKNRLDDAAKLNEIQIATGADARRLERRGPAALRDDVRADLIARGNQAGGRGVEAAAPASGAVRESTGEEGPEKHSAWLRSHGVANRLVAFEGRRKPVWAQAPPWCLSASRAGAGRYVGRPDSFLVRQDCPLRIIH